MTVNSSRSALRWIPILFVAALAGSATAAPGDNVANVRDLAGRVGQIIGSALACRDIAPPRVRAIADKFQAVITEAASNEAVRNDLTQLLNRYVAVGLDNVSSGRIDCKLVERQLSYLEQSLAGSTPNLPASSSPLSPLLAGVIAPSSVAAATALAAPNATAPVSSPVRGVTDREIRFGMVGPFGGAAKELGRQMKLGIDTAFNRINDAGGVEGRMLRLVAVDDG
jgi:branched-chain amino acid transport system substrate-binding protein